MARSNSWMAAMSLAAGVALALVPPHMAAAQAVDCSITPCDAACLDEDLDNDGWRNELECQGVLLLGGATVPSCEEDSSVHRTECMSPFDNDGFFMVDPASSGGEMIFQDGTRLMALLTDSSNGLGITLHFVPPTGDRAVTAEAGAPLALKLRETTSAAASKYGVCGVGTTATTFNCEVNTGKIRANITSICGGCDSCTNVTGESGEALINLQIQQVAAHEAAHGLASMVPRDFQDRKHADHYPAPKGAGNETQMQSQVQYTSKKGKCTFYIPTTFLPEDPTRVILQ